MMRKKLTPQELALLQPIFGYDMSGGSGESAPAPARMANPVQYIQDLGGDMGALYSPDGEWTGDDTLNTGTPTQLLMKGILASLAMYGGANALSGLGGAGGGADAVAELAGGGLGPEATSLGLSFEPSTAVGFNSGLGAFPAAGASPFTFGLPSAGVGDSLLSTAGQVAGQAAGGANLSKLLTNAVGAGIGAASTKDQQQTQTREPWGPAQDWIKSNIAQGQKLQQQYTDQPFSQQQQTGYNNLGGLLNTINQGAGGLFQGFGASAAGQNNFDRTNPRKPLIGSSFNLGGFSPGLLSFFGGK